MNTQRKAKEFNLLVDYLFLPKLLDMAEMVYVYSDFSDSDLERFIHLKHHGITKKKLNSILKHIN